MNDSVLPTESISEKFPEQILATSQAPASGGCESRKSCCCCRFVAWFLGCAIVLAIIIFVCWRLLTPKYTAKAYLRVAYQAPALMFSSFQEPNPIEYDIFKNTQAQLIKNRFVLAAAVRKPEINGLPILKKQYDPVSWLMKNLSVSFPGKAEVMEIGLTTYDPQEAAEIVTAVLEAYMTEVVDGERDQRRQRISDIDRIYTEKEGEVRNRRSELKQLAEQLGTAETETLTLKQRLTLEELASYRQELARSEFELGRLRSELASLYAERDAVKNTEISDIECEMFAQNDPVLKDLLQDIKSRKGEPENKDLARFQKDYAERIEQIRKEIHRKQIGEMEREIKRVEAAIEVANKQQQANEKDVQRLRKLAEQFGSSSIDVEMMRADIENREMALASIAAEREKLRIELRSASRITPLQKKAEAEKRPPLFFIP